MAVSLLCSRGWLPIACLAILVVSGCSGAESRKARHLEKGHAYFAAGNYEKARIEFRNALQIAPNESDIRFENGVVDEKLKNIREAAQFYQGAIDANADNVPAAAALGRLFLFGAAPDRALETIKGPISRHPDDVDLLTVRAAARIQQKDLSGGVQDAEHAIALAPENENAAAVLAGAYQTQGEPLKAQKLLEDSVKRLPASVDLRLALAQTDAGLGKSSEVEALLLDVVKLQPQEPVQRIRLAQFYARANQADEAERVLRAGVKTLPDNKELQAALIDFLSMRRGREAAEKELGVLIAANPKDYKLRFLQAQFYEQGNDPAKAEVIYREIIAAAGLEDAGLSARDRLAALRVQANDIPAADKLIAEVLAKSPRDNDALILRGNLSLIRKDPRTAIADLRSVLRDQPSAVGVMRALARAHLANGEPVLAEETMRRAVEANPTDSGARLDLAQLLAQLGKADQAEPVIADLAKQNPTDLKVLDAQYKIAVAAKDTHAARLAADALVAASPQAAIGYYFQGDIAEQEKHLDEALRLYTKALELQPQSIEPLQGSVRVLMKQNRTPEALKKLDDVIARFPASPLAANLKGEILEQTGHPADAAAAYKLAVEREPKWWASYRALAAVQVRSKDDDGAIATLKSGIVAASAPDELETYLALMYERLGKYDDAAQIYETALSRNPNADIASNNLAMLLVTYKKDAASLERAKKLASRFATSANPDFLDTYGWVLYKRGEAAAAVTVLQTVLSKTSDSPVSLYHLGMAEALAGQADAARDNLARSLKSGKNFPGIEEAKATLDKLAKDAAPANVAART